MESLKLLQTLQGHEDRVWCVAWSPDGGALASCGADKTVRIWAPARRPQPPPPQQQQQQQQQEGADLAAPFTCAAVLEDSHTKTIRACGWSHDGRHLATAGFDGLTAVWERHGGTWESVATLEGHENEVKCAAFSPSGSGVLATCGRDKAVWLWEHLPGNEFECIDVKPAHSADVKMVAWHPGGELLASCSYDDSIKLWAPEGGDEWECAQTLAGPSGHTSTVWCVAFSRDGRLMASCGDDKTVRVWACEFEGRRPAFRPLACIQGYHDRVIYSCSWSAGGLLATGDGANCLRVFGPAENDSGGGGGDGSSWAQLCCAPGAHESDVNCVAWHPSDPRLLASAGDDGAVRVWRLLGDAGGAALGGGGAAVGGAVAQAMSEGEEGG